MTSSVAITDLIKDIVELGVRIRMFRDTCDEDDGDLSRELDRALSCVKGAIHCMQGDHVELPKVFL